MQELRVECGRLAALDANANQLSMCLEAQTTLSDTCLAITLRILPPIQDLLMSLRWTLAMVNEGALRRRAA